MTIREKLVQILKVPIYPHLDADPAEVVADYLLDNGVTVQKWIPVSERLPEEHDSMFAKWYDTPLWKPGMFRTTSGDVLVCVEFGEGSRVVSTARTNAGEWNISSIFSGKVTHWMPLPEPAKEVVNHAAD